MTGPVAKRFKSVGEVCPVAVNATLTRDGSKIAKLGGLPLPPATFISTAIPARLPIMHFKQSPGMMSYMPTGWIAAEGLASPGAEVLGIRCCAMAAGSAQELKGFAELLSTQSSGKADDLMMYMAVLVSLLQEDAGAAAASLQQPVIPVEPGLQEPGAAASSSGATADAAALPQQAVPPGTRRSKKSRS